MKKSMFIAIIATLSMLIILMIFIWFVEISVNFDALDDIDIQTPSLLDIPDGVYQGSYEVFPLSVHVEVMISNETIEEIVVVNHSVFYDIQANDIINVILQNQTLDVSINPDNKYSEQILLLAIVDAIEQLDLVPATTFLKPKALFEWSNI